MVKFWGEIGTLYQIFTPCTPLPKYKRACSKKLHFSERRASLRLIISRVFSWLGFRVTGGKFRKGKRRNKNVNFLSRDLYLTERSNQEGIRQPPHTFQQVSQSFSFPDFARRILCQSWVLSSELYTPAIQQSRPFGLHGVESVYGKGRIVLATIDSGIYCEGFRKPFPFSRSLLRNKGSCGEW